MKYYMEDEREGVWTLNGFDEGAILSEMKRDIGGEMWCSEWAYFVSDDCGVECDDYKPCNGKNGRCRNLKNGFVETGRKFTLTDGRLILKESLTMWVLQTPWYLFMIEACVIFVLWDITGTRRD